MISGNIDVVDCHPVHWLNLVRGPKGDPKRKAPLLIVIHKDEIIVHAILGGKYCPRLVGERAKDLAKMRQEHGAGRVICIESGLLRRALSEGEGKLDYRMDYVEQLLVLIRSFRSERGAGLRIDPPTPPGPVPPFEWFQFAFDRLWPNGTCLVLYVVDDSKQELFTSLILRKQHGDIDLMTTDLHLGSAGLSARNWRVDRLRLIGSVTSVIAPVYMACFATLRAWKIWLRSPLGSPPFKRLVKEESMIIEPFPRRIAAISTLARLVARLLSVRER